MAEKREGPAAERGRGQSPPHAQVAIVFHNNGLGVTAYQNDRLLIAYLKLLGGVLTPAFAERSRA